MSATTRRAIAAAFRAAKPHLWDGRSTFRPSYRSDYTPTHICVALEISGHREWRSAVALIRNRIDHLPSLISWLAERGVDRAEMTSRRVQAHRHAWLDQLIAEFEADNLHNGCGQ